MDTRLRNFPEIFTRATVKLPRTVIWIAIALGLLILSAVVAAYFIDEPLRRQTEARINAALKGYSVRIGTLDFHPLGFSLDLEDTVIIQNANPEPPVARIPNLTAGIDWKALLFGRVVADFTIDDPVIVINLKHSETERRDPAALHERGWQAALQAIYPLKINELVISNGHLTYLDRGPYRPLELRNIDFTARNIRNVRSRAGVYPSDVHLQAAVFEKGRLELEGHADFLAEPHVAFTVGVAFDQIDLSYFRPITERYHFDVRGGVVSTAGTLEYAGNKKILDVPDLRVDRLIADYEHVKESSPTEELAKKTDRVIKEKSNDPGLEVRFNNVRIAGAELGMINRAANPEYRLFVTKTQLDINNLSNRTEAGVATARARGLFMGSGNLEASARFLPRGKSANFDLRLVIEEAEMKAMNRLFLATGNFDVNAGRFSVYTDISVRDGAVDGYVKPLFRDVDVYDVKQDKKKNIFRQIYEGLVGGLSWLLENRPRGEVATTTRSSGRLSNPETSTLDLTLGLIENAFFQTILPGLERSLEAERRNRK
ncbi:MAG: DUF748 domain-containing protein [Candidatus Binatia bacterium]